MGKRHLTRYKMVDGRYRTVREPRDLTRTEKVRRFDEARVLAGIALITDPGHQTYASTVSALLDVLLNRDEADAEVASR